jgi:predicted transcriptional regulator of viral defense system
MATKSSATLRYLESHGVFKLDEYLRSVDLTVDERTRYLNLRNALSRGQAYRVTRGLYASNLGSFRDRVPNVYAVAAAAADDAVVSHHTALELAGVAHTPFRTVNFTSSSRVAPFEVRGYRFERVAPPAAVAAYPDAFVTSARAEETLVPVTTRERTLVDCLRRPTLAGGVEELLRSVGGFTSMSANAVHDYTRLLGSPTLAARAGWVLSMMAESWVVSSGELEVLRRSLGRGTHWLEPKRPGVTYDFVAQWRLYVPSGLPYEGWLRG